MESKLSNIIHFFYIILMPFFIISDLIAVFAFFAKSEHFVFSPFLRSFITCAKLMATDNSVICLFVMYLMFQIVFYLSECVIRNKDIKISCMLLENYGEYLCEINNTKYFSNITDINKFPRTKVDFEEKEHFRNAMKIPECILNEFEDFNFEFLYNTAKEELYHKLFAACLNLAENSQDKEYIAENMAERIIYAVTGAYIEKTANVSSVFTKYIELIKDGFCIINVHGDYPEIGFSIL